MISANYVRVYEAFCRLAEGGNERPTLREVMDATGISSTSVAVYHMNKLTREGRLIRDRGRAQFRTRAYRLPQILSYTQQMELQTEIVNAAQAVERIEGELVQLPAALWDQIVKVAFPDS